MIIKFDNPVTGEEEYLYDVDVLATRNRESALELDEHEDVKLIQALLALIDAYGELKNISLCEKHEKQVKIKYFERKCMHMTRDEACAYAEGMCTKLTDAPFSSNPYSSRDLRFHWIAGYFDKVEKNDVNNGVFRDYGVFTVKDIQNLYIIRFFWEEEV